MFFCVWGQGGDLERRWQLRDEAVKSKPSLLYPSGTPRLHALCQEPSLSHGDL